MDWIGESSASPLGHQPRVKGQEKTTFTYYTTRELYYKYGVLVASIYLLFSRRKKVQ